MARRKSRGEAEMEAHLDKLDPSSDRYLVLVAAKEFKASWVQLGERLTLVRENDAFTEWGYSSFEAYCRRELRIKQDTANKLTRSFAFLRDHEPTVLKERPVAELPPLDVVDLLSQARERTKVTDNELETIRGEIFAPEAQPTKSDIVKRFREVDPDAFRSTPKAEGKGAGVGENDLRKALLLAERLQSLLESQEGVSRDALTRVRALVSELRQRFEESRQAGAA